ncbi:UPF0280 family protein [Psychromarinibacter sp. S121]|uniref:UPF0280 family protein n=1 Tax=Psychromarinibacter sp. S121 TaxID=3415127 RepID=UPI003C7E4BA3
MERASAAMLPDGRLHLHHGPIDIIADASGPARDDALRCAAKRFDGVLEDLATELPMLRTPITEKPGIEGPIARRMLAATAPFAPLFVTPMAAVAGSVADEIVAAMAIDGVTKAHANNGGDIAFHLTEGESASAVLAGPVPATIDLPFEGPVRGLATSGWRGRSHSLGIADSVTVLAASAAQADAAATLIASAVDLPGHPGILRTPADTLSPDSDLGPRPVTVDVLPLTDAERAMALSRGVAVAESYRARGLIVAALLVLGGDTRATGALFPVAESR